MLAEEMRPEQWRRVSTIVADALEQGESERHGFVREACSDEPVVLREVESLLALADASRTFLDAPAVRIAAEWIEEDDVRGQSIGPYELDRVLGTGGTGTVYLAKDTRLKRSVALKVLSPTFLPDADWVGALQREARAASSLNHPGILTIYEAGTVDGTHFIASEFIEGETLRDRIDRGRMEIPEVLEVASQMARALAAAHEAGIVHRDIKPENVMLRPDGYVKILDFGLANWTDRRSVEEILVARSGGTEVALPVIGSVVYMAPEQVRGLPVDARADVFSFAAVVYEMLAGRPPFGGSTPSEVATSICLDPLRPVSNYRPEVAPTLDGALIRALSKDPAERLGSIDEVFKESVRDEASQPIENQPAQDPPVHSPERFGQRFGLGGWIAAAVLLGSLAAGFLFLGRPTGEVDTAAAPAKTESGTDSAVAAAAVRYREGRHALEQRTEEGLRKAIDSFDEATVLDPGFGPAWAGLAMAYSLLPNYGAARPEVVRERARAAAERALALDSGIAEAHAAMGLVLKDHDWRFEAAREQFEMAIQLGGDDASARLWLAETLVVLGETEDALYEMQMARERAQFSPIIEAEVGWVLYHQRRFDEAVDALHGAREVDPDFARTYFFLGRVLEQLKRFDESIAAFDRAIELGGDDALFLGSRGHALARAGRESEAKAILRRLLERDEEEYVSPFAIALVHIGLGERDAAFSRLEEANLRRDPILPYYLNDPQLDAIRSDPAFPALASAVLSDSPAFVESR